MKYLSFASVLCWMLGTVFPASAQVSVSGTLLGADGHPMRQANVVVVGGPTETRLLATSADEHGQFHFALPAGGYIMYLMGVHHEALDLPMILLDGQPVDLRIHLAPVRMPDTLRAVRLVTASTDDEGVLMEPRADGTFAAHLDVSPDTLAYQVLGAKTTAWHEGLGKQATLRMSGTQSDRVAFNREGPFWDAHNDYISVVDVVQRPMEIIFDPTVLLRADVEPVIESTPSLIAELATIDLEINERSLRIVAVAHAYGQGVVNDEEYYTLTGQEQAPIRERIMAEAGEAPEQDLLHRGRPLAEQWLMLRYFDDLVPLNNDSLLANYVLESIPPTSVLWSTEAHYDFRISNTFSMIARNMTDLRPMKAYVDRVLAENTDPNVQAQFLYMGASLADGDGEESRKWHYYTRLLNEHKDSIYTTDLQRRYAHSRAIREGESLPDFAFEALADSSLIHANLNTPIYLVDFWGTWCGKPCLEDMPYLHEAYATYHERGFEILSVAMVNDRADVALFREKQWPMPWLHALVPPGDDEAVRATFEIVHSPRRILVDGSGTIIGLESTVRGENLLNILAERLGTPNE